MSQIGTSKILPHRVLNFHGPAVYIVKLCLSCFQMRCALARTASCSILSSSSLERRMQPTTTPADTTPLAKRSLISYLIASENWLTSALVCRVSSSSTALAVAPALVLHRCSWSVCQLTTARSQSSSSPSTLPRRYPLPSLSRTTRS